MFQTRRQSRHTVFLIVMMAIIPAAAPAWGVVVTPRIGGADRKHDVAPMIMPEITIDEDETGYKSIRMLVKQGAIFVPWQTLTGNARPQMWPLQGDDTLEAGAWYNALDGMAWNWQYGWNNAGFNAALLPAGGKVWLEVLSQSEGLNTYDRTANSYAPIFGTNGSSSLWKWTEMMAHNAYTVEPGYGEWFATYRVYIGDATTGDPMAGFGSAEVTLTWTSVPEPATLALLAAGIIFLRRYGRNVNSGRFA